MLIQVCNIARHFPCLALDVQSIPQLIECFGLAKRTFECDP